MPPIVIPKTSYVGKIAIPDTNKTYYYKPDQIYCMQSGGNHVVVYHEDRKHPDGFNTKVPCGWLKLFEENIKDHSCFMRVHDCWIVNLDHVASLSKNNIIELDVDCCKQLIELDPKLRAEFKRRMVMRNPAFESLPDDEPEETV